MSNHTPGPWHLWLDKTGSFTISIDRDGTKVITQRGDWSNRAEESMANARLIAAAPELLETLKALVNHADNMEAQDADYHNLAEGGIPCRSPPLIDAMAAIAKAESPTP